MSKKHQTINSNDGDSISESIAKEKQPPEFVAEEMPAESTAEDDESLGPIPEELDKPLEPIAEDSPLELMAAPGARRRQRWDYKWKDLWLPLMTCARWRIKIFDMPLR